jgi:hypothetical protein
MLSVTGSRSTANPNLPKHPCTVGTPERSRVSHPHHWSDNATPSARCAPPPTSAPTRHAQSPPERPTLADRYTPADDTASSSRHAAGREAEQRTRNRTRHTDAHSQHTTRRMNTPRAFPIITLTTRVRAIPSTPPMTRIDIEQRSTLTTHSLHDVTHFLLQPK